MEPPKEKVLVVEGGNDRHAILHLLRESGVLAKNLDPRSSPLEIVQVGSKKGVIDDLAIRWKESNRKQIGYVLDADRDEGDPPGCQPTWQAIHHQLSLIGIQAPTTVDSAGFICEESDQRPQIGVWIMPDNSADGAIEEFLFSLVDQQQPLMQYAKEATLAAKMLHGAGFPRSKQAKAELACWLAWQEEPAMTYGQSVQAGKFDLQMPPARSFCAWIRRLFEL